MSARLRIAVLMGGPSAERDVSLHSGAGVAAALRRKGYPVTEIEITADRRWRFPDRAPEAAHVAIDRILREIDVVFPALHGPFGEDGTLQGFLDACGVRYVGSGVAASAVAMDKALTRRVAASIGLRVADAVEGGPANDAAAVAEIAARAAKLTFPLYVKPACSGSSVGVSRVANAGELTPAIAAALAEGGRVVIETGVAGREVSCPVLGDAFRGARALPVVEVRPKGHAFFDYSAKYTPGGSEDLCPAPLPAETTRALQESAVRIHDHLGCRSLSRSDFMVPERGEPVFLETNTLPGMTDLSLVPLAARTAGMSYEELCAHLVEGAAARGAEQGGKR